MSTTELLGYRCSALSTRHRDWGVNVPAVDADLFLEYDRGELAALVEYKWHSQTANPSHPSLQCLLGIAAKCQVPLVLVHYVTGDWVFHVRPLNDLARLWFPRCHQVVSERDWVTFLYKVRGRGSRTWRGPSRRRPSGGLTCRRSWRRGGRWWTCGPISGRASGRRSCRAWCSRWWSNKKTVFS